ncbi:MAG: GNAT family N-acetyltransferase [Rubrivivax sp.]|nr:GNAT family N-acetyltransferase [Rubrivivax sp.]
MNTPLPVKVSHLFQVPQQRFVAAALIHHAFWTTVPGASVETMAARLLRASQADRVPLCLVALHEGELVGVVNLVDDDDEDHAEWTPWLAGMVVRQDCRGRGVGSALVRELLVHARRLGFERVYFGTDGPGFYTRLGAVVHEQPRADFWFMRFDLGD